jgi:hypothetical protein
MSWNNWWKSQNNIYRRKNCIHLGIQHTRASWQLSEELIECTPERNRSKFLAQRRSCNEFPSILGSPSVTLGSVILGSPSVTLGSIILGSPSVTLGSVILVSLLIFCCSTAICSIASAQSPFHNNTEDYSGCIKTLHNFQRGAFQ